VEIQQAMTEVRAQVSEETKKAQLPWGHTNLIGSVYLNAAAMPLTNTVGVAPAGPALAMAPRSGNADVELEFWRSVRDSNKPEELNAYLNSYPKGQFRSLAQARLAAVENGGPKDKDKDMTRNLTAVDPATFTEEANQVTEDRIGLDRGQRRDVQRRLTGLGFDNKVTGKFDDETRSVIRRWQAARGYPASGYLNQLQHKALLSEMVANLQSGAAEEPESRASRHHGGGGGGRRYYRSTGGGGGGGGGGGFPLFGGMMGGLFGRH
jgi:hypothetical protein